uniref:Uncharacterized protein n=1 Tax=Palisada sp. TaxID=1955416 RepID=A0A1Z1MRG5_9FLOR|nr:hypothetical protein [Palisada sp.]
MVSYLYFCSLLIHSLTTKLIFEILIIYIYTYFNFNS